MSFPNLRNSVGLRLVLIAILSLLLLIPVGFIMELISEREQHRESVIREVSSKWGDNQVISGPVLTVPYLVHDNDVKKGITTTTEYARFLPEELNIAAKLDPNVRYRGIYEVVLYNAKMDITGNFSNLDVREFNIAPENMIWKDAYFELGITDMRGIRDVITVAVNDTNFLANPGIQSGILRSGVSLKPGVPNAAGKYDFSLKLNLNGSGDLQFLPLGKTTKVKVNSPWNNPSFTGQYLPERRDITSNGFEAEWKIFHLNRNFPQKWTTASSNISNVDFVPSSSSTDYTNPVPVPDSRHSGSSPNFESAAFGVNLLMPVDNYQTTMRTAKYAIMFIGFTFIAFFMIELLIKKALHPIQYLLIGMALVIFYTLLLSFSEHLQFGFAYLIASAAIVLLITLYTRSAAGSNLVALVIAGILSILYGVLYVILQLQDFALLFGSIGLFVTLALVMYITRRIDWFSLGKTPLGSIEPPIMEPQPEA
ncbi:MAG: cell envelope integrity protein CreD [Bacteroidota bacterium]